MLKKKKKGPKIIQKIEEGNSEQYNQSLNPGQILSLKSLDKKIQKVLGRGDKISEEFLVSLVTLQSLISSYYSNQQSKGLLEVAEKIRKIEANQFLLLLNSIGSAFDQPEFSIENKGSINMVCNLLTGMFTDIKLINEANTNIGGLFLKQKNFRNIKNIQTLVNHVTEQMGLMESKLGSSSDLNCLGSSTALKIVRKVVEMFLLFLTMKKKGKKSGSKSRDSNNLKDCQGQPLADNNSNMLQEKNFDFMDFIELENSEEPKENNLFFEDSAHLEQPKYSEQLKNCNFLSLFNLQGLDFDDSVDSGYSRDFSQKSISKSRKRLGIFQRQEETTPRKTRNTQDGRRILNDSL